MGQTLTGQIVADTYDALIKVTDNNTITGTKKRMTDGVGNDTPLLISSTDVQVDGNFLTESVQFNTATLQTADTVGKMAWNDQDGTIDVRLKGGNVTLQIGQEQVSRVVNKTGANLLESEYKVVKVDGAQGNRLKVALAQANNDANSAETLGIVTETIADNQEGFITTSGLVRNINTTGSLQGETWADGDMLYLSGTTPGQLTKVKPTAPTHTVIMGYVVRAHATQGQIYVKVDNGYELDELHNVLITTPSNGQVLAYESATGIWKNISSGTVTSVGLTLGTSGTDANITGSPITSSGSFTLNLPTASATNRGLLSSSDWTIFNNKQNALINPVTGTGTTNTIPKFTSASAIGNSNIADSGTLITLGSNSYVNGLFAVGELVTNGYKIQIGGNHTGSTITAGVRSGGTVLSDVTSLHLGFWSSIGTQATAFTLPALSHFRATQSTFGAGSTVTNQYGFEVASSLIGGTNNFGFRGAIAAGTNRWNLYMDGTANNHLAGSLVIGTTALSAQSLRIGKTITGNSVSMGVYQNGQVQSDVGFGYGFNNESVISGTVIATDYIHYRAVQGTWTAGGTVTNQIAYFANSSLTSGTNNFSFRGDIAVGSGRWNLYMNGTATNYLAGVLTIGTTSPSASALLQMNSTTQGFLPPRMTSAQRTAIASPAIGLMVYQTDSIEGMYVYKSSGWALMA